MYIGRIMHTDLITVSLKTSLVEARRLIEEKQISHLIVLDDQKQLAGILSDRDLMKYWASPATSLAVHELNYLLEKVTVSMVMTKTVVTIPVSTTIERAAFTMQQNKINSLPVVESGNLVGIITSSDVMDVLLNVIGIQDNSARLSVFVNDTKGALAKVAAILRDAGINIQSLFCWPEKELGNIYQLIFRVADSDRQQAIEALTTENYAVKSHYEKNISKYLPT